MYRNRIKKLRAKRKRLKRMSQLREVPTKAELSETVPSFALKPPKHKGAIKQGVVYERNVGEFLKLDSEAQSLAWTVNDGPWIKYWGKKGGPYWAQPDFVLMDKEKQRVLIVEVKLTHCANAFFQLENMYKPLLRKILGTDWTINTLEIYANATQMVEPGKRSYVRHWWREVPDGTCGMCRLSIEEVAFELEELRPTLTLPPPTPIRPKSNSLAKLVKQPPAAEQLLDKKKQSA
jgi:hypothetical protein